MDERIDCTSAKICDSLSVASFPIIARSIGLKEIDASECHVPSMEWILGNAKLRVRGVSGISLTTYTSPRPPARRWLFRLERPRFELLAGIGFDTGLMEKSGGSSLFNPNPYLNVSQIVVTEKAFPGCVEGPGYMYGIPQMEPLEVSGRIGKCSTEKLGGGPGPGRFFRNVTCSGARGVSRCRLAGSGEFYSDGMNVFFEQGASVDLDLGVYRPRAKILHPYMFVDMVLEEGVEYESPAISVYRYGKGWLSIVSNDPLRVVLERGIFHVDSKSSMIIVEGGGIYGVRSFQASITPPVEVGGSPRRGKLLVARIDWGGFIVDNIELLEERVYELEFYTPLEGEWNIVFRIPGRIIEASLDGDVVDIGLDRLKAWLTGPGLWRLMFRVGRRLKLLIG